MVPPPRCPPRLHPLLHRLGHVVSLWSSVWIRSGPVWIWPGLFRSSHPGGCLSLNRGAGCIFVEMLQGAPAFPGEAEELEQLQTIWTVRWSWCLCRAASKKSTEASHVTHRCWGCPLRTPGLKSACCPGTFQVRGHAHFLR